MHSEECSFLAKLVELRVSVEQASGDELVEDSYREWRKKCEEDVEQRQGPGFEDRLTRETVLEGVLSMLVRSKASIRGVTYPELCHEHGNVLVE